MRFTHGNGICRHRNCCVKSGNRNLKCRIAVCIHRFIFFTVHDHIVVIRTAEFYRCCYFSFFYGKRNRRCDGCSSTSTFQTAFGGITAIRQSQLLRCYRFVLLLFCDHFCLRILGSTPSDLHSSCHAKCCSNCNVTICSHILHCPFLSFSILFYPSFSSISRSRRERFR